ncbi:MAG: hypothetical protein DI535_04440 [Citrobacter freundii]|nr:MAG: hypothetical protein DI535_04440 [Citrobacter freundii]
MLSNHNNHTTPIKVWTINKEQKNRLRLDDTRFIFEQADKMLRETIEIGNIIATRTNTLITISSGSLIATISYLITTIRNLAFDSLFFIGVITTIYLFVLVYYGFENIKPAVYISSGSLPEILVDQFLPDYEIANYDQLRTFYINEFENYQFRIETNIGINRLRWKRYNNLLKSLLLLPIGMVLGFLLS